MYEFYDDLVSIWGGSSGTEPLSYGVTTEGLLDAAEALDERGSYVAESDSSNSAFNEKQEKSNTHATTPVSRKRSVPVSIFPKLIDNKRKHLEKPLSVAQRDQILMTEAREDKEIRQNLASSLRESSNSFNTALQSMIGSMHQNPFYHNMHPPPNQTNPRGKIMEIIISMNTHPTLKTLNTNPFDFYQGVERI